MTTKNDRDRNDPDQGAYNGFSLHERFLATAAGDRHPGERPRFPPRNLPCSGCGTTTGSVWWHAEDYRMPLDTLPICPWCHWALHGRFTRPGHFNAWRVMISGGWRPIPHEKGMIWRDDRRLFSTATADLWPGEWHGTTGPPDSIHDLVPLGYRPTVPSGLAIADGAPHHRYQWQTKSVIRWTA